MTEQGLWRQAAGCYESVGALADAARCYRQGGAERQAAELYTRLGQHRNAAEAFCAAGMADEAAWRLAHLGGDPAAARAILAQALTAGQPVELGSTALVRRLVHARCDVAEQAPPDAALDALAEAQQILAGDYSSPAPQLEEWSVALAESMRRFDQVALIYAAAVRGGRVNAAHRWQAWMKARFGTEIVIPAIVTAEEA